jgi:hypothetical protein
MYYLAMDVTGDPIGTQHRVAHSPMDNNATTAPLLSADRKGGARRRPASRSESRANKRPASAGNGGTGNDR